MQGRSHPEKKSCLRFAVIFIFVLVVMSRFLFPGDICFLGDQGILLETALRANRSGHWVTHGLSNPRGVYGPVPIWIWQAFLKLSTDPIIFSCFKNFVSTALIVFSLLLLRPLFAVSVWIYLVPFLSPYIFFYCRDLWDNCWLIPFTALALSSYLRFRSRPSLFFFALTICMLGVSLATHLQALPVAIAIGFDLLLHHRPWLKRNAIMNVVTVGLVLLLTSPYLAVLAGFARPEAATQLGGAATSYAPSFPGVIPFLAGIGNAFLSPRYFSFIGFDVIAGKNWWRVGPIWWLLPVAYAVTAFALFPILGGLFISLRDLLRGEKRFPSGLLLLIFAIHVFISALKGLGDHPHYYNSLWFVLFLFFVRCAFEFWPRVWFRRAFAAYLLGLAIAQLGFVETIHRNHGGRHAHYGPTLANQLALAKKLSDEKAGAVVLGPMAMPGVLPRSLEALRRSFGEFSTEALPPAIILYADEENVADSLIRIK